MAQQKSWQTRIAEATDALAQSFVESISYDRRLYKHDIAGSIAHAHMLARVGLISAADRDAIVAGLRSIEADIDAGNFVFDQSLEDIHMVIEDALIRRIGDPGRKLHTARSRNDQVATDLLLWLLEACGHLAGDLLPALMRELVNLAERSIDIVMPAYTHMQRAQPVSAAAEALAWAEMFDADRLRLDHLQTAIRRYCPLGSGAVAGSSLPVEPTSLVGDPFAAPPCNSIERTSSRDSAADFLFALAMIAMHLSRWAEQWIIYSTTEFGFIRIADRYTTGSSMMPQKRNPDMLELIRGRCGNVYGDLLAMLTILKGLPLGYNRDLQEDKRLVFRSCDTVCASLTIAAAIVASARFVPENIAPSLERGFLDATSLAEYLVTRGVPFRTAHQIVGTLVARCEKLGLAALSQLPLEDISAAVAAVCPGITIGPDVREALGAANVVSRYRSPGASGGQPLREQLRRWKQRLGDTP